MNFGFHLSLTKCCDASCYLLLLIQPEACINNTVLKNSVCDSKKTPHFTIKYIRWLMLFKEIISVCTENHTNLIRYCKIIMN
jgi:hypothetical protein